MKYYNEQWVDALQDALEQRNKVLQDFLKHILIGAVSLFGILLSLRRADSFGSAGIEIVFSCSVLILSLGILFGCVSLYSVVHLRVRAVRKTRAEIQLCMKEHRNDMRPVSVDAAKIFSICTVASYISLGLSVMGLGVCFFVEAVF